MDGFTRWISDNGAVLNGAELRYFPELQQYKMIASMDIDAGSMISSLPQRLIVSPVTILHQSCFGRYLARLFGSIRLQHDERTLDMALGEEMEDILEISSEILLVAFLAHERHAQDSFWAPYLSILPKNPTSPYLWSDEELRRQLECTPLYQPIQSKFKELRSYLDGLQESGVELRWEDFLWAYCIVKSRAFPFIPPPENAELILVDGKVINAEVLRQLKGCITLLPLLDMLNHYPRTPITWRVTPRSFDFVVENSFTEGSELFNNYGPKSNTELFVGYGFTLPWELQQDFDYVDFRVVTKNGAISKYVKYDDSVQALLDEIVGPDADTDVKLAVLDHMYEMLETRLQRATQRISDPSTWECLLHYFDGQQRILAALIEQIIDLDAELVGEDE